MKTAEQFVADGDLKFESKDFKAAVSDYTKAKKLEPKNPDIYYNRGLAEVFLNKISAALEDFSAPSKSAPSSKLALSPLLS